MKKYNYLTAFGCSYTEGGGLNSPEHHRYLSGNHTLSREELSTYMTKNSYPSYLAKHLNCEYINKGISRGSNELIFKMLYEYTQDIQDGTGLLICIQTSILSRILLYLENEKKFQTVNGMYGPIYLQQYYQMYIKHFYNDDIELKKLQQNIVVYSEYLKNKNIDFIWLIGDTGGKTIMSSKNIMTFDDGLFSFITRNKLRLCDLPKYPTTDLHASETGNEVIAQKIIEHLKEYYGN